eukprot:8390162-Pyramimonas_sp.AAC.1
MSKFEGLADAPTPVGAARWVQKPNQNVMTDGCPRSTRNQKLILSHMSWRYGTQSCERKRNCWRQLHYTTSVPYPHRWFLIRVY